MRGRFKGKLKGYKLPKLYAVDYRDMHTAVHGLLIFKEFEQAVRAVDTINNCQGDALIVEDAVNDCYACVEEVDYRALNEYMHLTFKVNFDVTESSLVKIINYNKSVDIYF